MRIDHLRLRLDGMSPREGEMVGKRVCELLAAANLNPARNYSTPLLRHGLRAKSGENAEETAERIAREILNRLEGGL